MSAYFKDFFRNLLVITLFILAPQISGATDIKISSSKEAINIGDKIFVYEDKSSKLGINKIISKKFVKSHSKVPNFGISESTYWIKIPLHNTIDANDLLFSLSLPTLDVVNLYTPNSDGESYSVEERGEQFPFKKRKYLDPYYIFDLNIKQGESKVFYLQIASKENIQLPMSISTKSKLYEEINSRDVLSGIYFGIMFVMILYNLFIFYSVRDKSYLWYVGYIVIILITQTILQGYPFQYLWPNNPWIAQHSLFIFPSLTGIFGMEFMKVFLRVKEHSHKLYQLSYILMIPYVASIFCAIIQQYKISYHIMETNAMLVSIYMLSTGIIVLRKGFRPAKFFLFAWSSFLIGVCIYILKDFEILPFNNFTRYTMHIGSGVETILLSFALADRINILKKEKEIADAEVMKALKENERIVREQNIVLEEQVKARTTELVDAEKMASLGQLTAGVAHEINNPINFVSSNVNPLKRDIDDILTILNKYDEIDPSGDVEEKLKEINDLKEKLELDFLKDEVNSLLNGIEDGAKRTAEIVRGLRNFSRLDESELKKADIVEGIESTLTILNSNLNAEKIVIEKNYNEIPETQCFPGKLNQLFLNIMNNSVQAINKVDPEKERKITISTQKEDENIIISFKDTGIGMSQETVKKVFEPFFTTKDVGEGTGLGMSIAHTIIEAHNGKIDVQSEEGVGTEFLITLPIK